jgi:hypothetical protein
MPGVRGMGKRYAIEEKIEIDANGCWLWTGYIDADGYGKWRRPGRGAHLVVWEDLRGPIPDGLELDHLCRVTRCVNPDHLEPVTRAENIRRRYALYTHCKNGHPFDEANTYRWRNRRCCRACNRVNAAKSKERREMSAAPPPGSPEAAA